MGGDKCGREMKRLKNSVGDRALESASAGGGEVSAGFASFVGPERSAVGRAGEKPAPEPACLPACLLSRRPCLLLLWGHQAPRAGSGGRRRVGAGLRPREWARVRSFRDAMRRAGVRRAAGHCWPFQSRRVPVCSRRAPPGTRSWGCGVSGVRRGGTGEGKGGRGGSN